MQKYLVVVYFYVVALFSCIMAQDIGLKENNTDPKITTNNDYLGFNATKALFPFAPRYELSFLKPINERWMYKISLGYGNKKIMPFSLNNFVGNDYQLAEVSVEVRRFYNNTSKKYDYYYASELFFLRHTDVLKDGDYTDKNGYFYYDHTEYRRDKYGINLKLGFMSKNNNRIKSDYYIGAGYAIRSNDFSNSINLSGPTNGNERELDEGCIGYFVCGEYLQKKGIDQVYNLVLGMNILYKIGK